MTGLPPRNRSGVLTTPWPQPQGLLSLAEALSNYPVRKPAMSGLAQCLVPQCAQGDLNIGGRVTWLGHEFTVYEREGGWLEVGGLYIFAGIAKGSQGKTVWHAFYIGQCQSFAGYIPIHRKWSAAHRLGATHVHARVELGVLARDKVEAELVQFFQPPLNVQLK